MSAIILRDEIIHYEVLGRGRPIIFIHDWVGSWRYWIPTMQAASLSFRAYALDLWGFGDTAKNPSYYSLEQQLSLIEEFLEELGIGKIALVGHGLGAILAALYAIRHPAEVDRLMVISLPSSESAITPRLRSNTPDELADWLMGRTTATESAWFEASKADPKAITLSMVSVQNINLTQLPDLVKNPCVMVDGIDDPAIEAVPPEQITALPEHMHHILFDQSGHYPMLDEPAKFNRLLTDFLSLPSSESPRQLQIKEEWKRRVR
jgi:pimeloyl-ACP methyl ester carboxylesterase